MIIAQWPLTNEERRRRDGSQSRVEPKAEPGELGPEEPEAALAATQSWIQETEE